MITEYACVYFSKLFGIAESKETGLENASVFWSFMSDLSGSY